MLRLLSAVALPLCRPGGARARLSAVTAERLFSAGCRSSSAPVSEVGAFLEKEKNILKEPPQFINEQNGI